MKTRCAALFIVVATIFQAAPPRSQSSAGAGGNAENGKKLFTADGCYECHGRQAQGGAAGPRLGPPRLPVEAVKIYVRHPTGAMPPYTTKVLSDFQIDDIYAFLKAIPIPPPVKNMPLLSQ